MSFYKAFINFFHKAFIKLFILSSALPFISRESIIDIPLNSKKRRQAKFCLVDEWS